MTNIILHDALHAYESSIYIEKITPYDVYRAASFNDVDTLVAKVGSFRALLTEPITHKEPTSIDGQMQREYRQFLANTRFNDRIPVIIYTSLSEIDATKEFGLNTTGLMENIHYDSFVSRVDPEADIKLIEFLRMLKKIADC